MSTHWVDAPQELLKHGLGHLQGTSDFDRLIAFLSIDNAVELMLREYLRTHFRKVGITNFPELLDLLRQTANDKIANINVDEVRRLHSRRNTIYHDGYGLSIDKRMAERYAEIAKSLFYSLFNIQIEKLEEIDDRTTTNDFRYAWEDVEEELMDLARVNEIGSLSEDTYLSVPQILEAFKQKGILPDIFLKELQLVYQFNNNLFYGNGIPSEAQIKEHYQMAEELFEVFERLKGLA